MTLKHIDFYDSPVMIELAKNAIKKGSVKPSVSDVIGRVASTRKYAATGDLFVDLIKLADGLRERGLVSDAIALEGKIVEYKRASIMDEAHPEGDVEIAKAEDGHGVVETKPTEHKMLEEIVKRNPTGKMASLTQSILKMAESVLVKMADDNDKLWSEEEEPNLSMEEKRERAVEKLKNIVRNVCSETYTQLAAVPALVDQIQINKDSLITNKDITDFWYSWYPTTRPSLDKIINFCSFYKVRIDNIISGTIGKKDEKLLWNVRAYLGVPTDLSIEEGAAEATKRLNDLIARSGINNVEAFRLDIIKKIKRAYVNIINIVSRLTAISEQVNNYTKLSEFIVIADEFKGFAKKITSTKRDAASDKTVQTLNKIFPDFVNLGSLFNVNSEATFNDTASKITNASMLSGVVADNSAAAGIDACISIIDKSKNKKYDKLRELLGNLKSSLKIGADYYGAPRSAAAQIFTNVDSYYSLKNEITDLSKMLNKEVNNDDSEPDVPVNAPAGPPATLSEEEQGKLKEALELPTSEDIGASNAARAQKSRKSDNGNAANADDGLFTTAGVKPGIIGGASGGANAGGQKKPQSTSKGGTPLVQGRSPQSDILKMQQLMLNKFKDQVVAVGGIGKKGNPNDLDGVWGDQTKTALEMINKDFGLQLNVGPFWTQNMPYGKHNSGAEEAAKKNITILSGRTGEKQVKSEVYDSIDPEKVRVGQILCQGDVPVRSEYFGSLLAFRDFIVNDIWSRVSAGTVMTYNSGMSHLNFFKTRAEKLLSEQKKAQPNNDQKQANEQKIEMLERYRAAAYNLMSKLRAVYDRMSPQNPDAPIPTSLLSSGNNVPTGAQKPQHRPGSTPGGTDGPDGVDVDKYNKKGTGDESKNPVQRILRLNSPYFTSEYGNNIPYIFRVGELDLTQFEAYGYDELMHIIRPVREDSGENVDTARLLQELQKKYGLPAVAPTQMAGFYPTEGRRGLWYQGDDGNIYVATTDGKWSEISKSNDENIKKIYENARNTETTYDLKSFLISLREKLPTAFNLWADAQGFEGETRVKHGAMVFPWVSAIKKKLADINNQRSGRSGRSGYRP